jgi:CBS domain-containing protein
LLKAYRDMVTIRRFEERVQEEFSKGGIPGFVHLYAGEEAAAVGVCSHLGPQDYIASTHRVSRPALCGSGDRIEKDPDQRGTGRPHAERGISGAPVVDSSGRLVGIIGEGDLLRRAEIGTARRHRERRRSWWLDHFASDLAREYVESHGRTVKDLMTRDVVTVTEDMDLGDVAALLEAKRIKRVPVMREGKIVGIISRANIVRTVGATKGAPQHAGDGDDRSIRASLLAELGREEWAQVWPEAVGTRRDAAPPPARRFDPRTAHAGGAIAEPDVT